MIKKIKKAVDDYFFAKYGGGVVWLMPESDHQKLMGTGATIIKQPPFDYHIEVKGDDFPTFDVEFNTYGGIAEDIKVSVRMKNNVWHELPPLDDWLDNSSASHIQDQIQAHLSGEL